MTTFRDEPWPDEPWPIQRQRESAGLDDRDSEDDAQYVALVGERRTLLAEIDRLQTALAARSATDPSEQREL